MSYWQLLLHLFGQNKIFASIAHSVNEQSPPSGMVQSYIKQFAPLNPGLHSHWHVIELNTSLTGQRINLQLGESLLVDVIGRILEEVKKIVEAWKVAELETEEIFGTIWVKKLVVGEKDVRLDISLTLFVVDKCLVLEIAKVVKFNGFVQFAQVPRHIEATEKFLQSTE